MREIGGYIELDRYALPMLHEDGIKLNCGRNALAYLIQAKKIRKIYMPKFMCSSCNKVLKENHVEVRYYSVDLNFKPINVEMQEDEWLYLVNYYGQLSNSYIEILKGNIIVDNAQAYFQMPVKNVHTLYTCRKYFGVSDGAVLYTDVSLDRKLEQDISYERVRFLLGRFEKMASEFYMDYVSNNSLFDDEPIKYMSKLTENLLHGIDYEYVKKKRTENFTYLHGKFEKRNKLKLQVPEGAFMYPLYVENGVEIRKKLQEKKIFIPVLWPAVFHICDENELEYDMAKNILPLPVDQRYGIGEMEYIYKYISMSDESSGNGKN